MHRLKALAAIGFFVAGQAALAQAPRRRTMRPSCRAPTSMPRRRRCCPARTPAKPSGAVPSRRRTTSATAWSGCIGYLTGRNGPAVGKLTRDWISTQVTRLGKACAAAADPAKTRIVDLVQKP